MTHPNDPPHDHEHAHETLAPWEVLDARRPSAARILRGLAQFHEPMWEHYRYVTVPAKPAPVPVGALLTLWLNWEEARSSCPSCGALALMTGFGGLLSIGSMSGVCIGCAHVVFRYTPGLLYAVKSVQRAMRHTEFTWPMWSFPLVWSARGNATALVAALQELGARHLPSLGRARL